MDENSTQHYCPECGKAVSGGIRFCPECGAELPIAEEKPTVEQAGPHFCMKCGAQLNDGELFCQRCGTRVGETGAPMADAPQQDAASQPAAAPAAPQKKKNRWLLPVIIGAAVVIVAAVLAIVLSVTSMKSVNITETSIELEPGGCSFLNVEFTPTYARGKTLTWMSTDESVAMVDAAGCVYANGEGECAIVATAQNGMYDTCAVTVQPPVSAVVLSDETLALGIGDAKTMTFTLEPAGVTAILTWASSDTSVATVNDAGTVTAVAAGTCTITATAPNGVSASCEVTVCTDPGEAAVIGVWSSTGTITYGTSSSDSSYEADNGSSILILYADHTGKLTLGTDEYEITNWSYDSTDTDDGDYNYTLTVSAGSFWCFISNDASYPNTLGCFFLIVGNDGCIMYAKASAQ